MSDKSVERPLKLEVGYLSLFKMQPESWDFALDACCDERWRLRWRFVVVECLALCFRRRAQ